MGSKGYCAVCDGKNVAAREASKAEKKKKIDKYLTFGGLIALVIAIVVVVILVAGRKQDTTFTSDTSNDGTVPSTSTTAPAQAESGAKHAPGSFSADTISGKHHIAIEVKDYGTIKVELDADVAPITVANFLNLAESGFYNGLTFHRIMEGFMMQGGDPEGTGMGGSDIEIKGEFTGNGVNNPLSHTRGAISMARAGYSMDSASSQFFIVHEDSQFLDGQYACFGYVTEGMDIVDAVCAYSTGVVTDDNGTVPAEKQPGITSITVID
ncbi:MAG: peptidylprolyl isomerase [Oscillospiraceae bacterium]|nr:peptidylprolyl isomerase [Oscillospiraceae bacterium]